MGGSFWIIAGHNGAGKTTLARNLLQHVFADAVHVNADDIAADLRSTGSPAGIATDLLAANMADGLVDRFIEAGQSCAVETVLSSDKHQSRVRAAKRQGMFVGLIYVLLSTEELAVERVALRYSSGGHNVPEDKIRQRRRRSIENLPWFFEQADYALVFCNDEPHGTPVLLAEKTDGKLSLNSGIVPEIDAVLSRLLPPDEALAAEC